MINLVLGKKNKKNNKTKQHSIFFLQKGIRTVAKAKSFLLGGGRKLDPENTAGADVLLSREGTSRSLCWVTLGTGSLQELVIALVCLSQRVRLTSYQRHPQGQGMNQRAPGFLLIPECWHFSDPNRRSQTLLSAGSAESQSTWCSGLGLSQRKHRTNERFPLSSWYNTSFPTYTSSQFLIRMNIEMKYKRTAYSIWEFCLLLFLFQKWFRVRSPLCRDVQVLLGRTPTLMLHHFGI